MNDTTIVAIIILVGVFVVTIVAVFKDGIDGAVKMWSVMGTLTGLAFGGITSYYFTSEVKQQKINQANADRDDAINMARRSAELAGEAYQHVLAVEDYLRIVDEEGSASESASSESGLSARPRIEIEVVEATEVAGASGILRVIPSYSSNISTGGLTVFSSNRSLLLDDISKVKERLRDIQSLEGLEGGGSREGE